MTQISDSLRRELPSVFNIWPIVFLLDFYFTSFLKNSLIVALKHCKVNDRQNLPLQGSVDQRLKL